MREDSAPASVEQWGYACGSAQEAAALVWPVRFKPGVTCALVLAGLWFPSPGLLLVTGGLGILGTFVQKLSWIDLLYNRLVRRPFKAPPLGPDPSFRRWLCGSADLCVLLAGFFQRAGHPATAYVLGGMVALLSGSVVLTGICLPAYLLHRWKAAKR